MRMLMWIRSVIGSRIRIRTAFYLEKRGNVLIFVDDSEEKRTFLSLWKDTWPVAMSPVF